MSYSIKQKLSNLEPYSQYFTASNYLTTNQCQTPKNARKIQAHKRRTSQVSTLSFKSHNKFLQSNEKASQSSIKNKRLSHAKTENKQTNALKKQTPLSARRKQFSVQKNSKTQNKIKNYMTNRKYKLKIETFRKDEPKAGQSLTSRSAKIQNPRNFQKYKISSEKQSQRSFGEKQQRMRENLKEKGKSIDDKKTILRLKLKGQNLDNILKRCEKVMTQYYEKINILQQHNKQLEVQNKQLKQFQYAIRIQDSTKNLQGLQSNEG